MSEENELKFGSGKADQQYDELVNFDPKVYRTLLGQLERAEEKEASARGDKGSAIKKIEDAKFNKWAFKQTKSLVNMTPTLAQHNLTCLLGYGLVSGLFDQLDLFARDEIHKRVVEIVAILNDRAGEVNLDISYASKPAEAEAAETKVSEDDGMEEGKPSETGEGEGLVADSAEVDTDEETVNGDDIDSQPEDSGAIFNTGKAHAEQGGYKEDCPYEDGRSKEAKLWNKGFESVQMGEEASKEGDEVSTELLGDETPEFPSEDAVH